MVASRVILTPGEVAAYYRTRVRRLKQGAAQEWRGPCPVHNGEGDNFAVDPMTGRWFCHSACGSGGDIFNLEQKIAGATTL
jgi:DNA primase